MCRGSNVLITYNGHGFDNHVLDAAINGVAIDPKRRKSARRIATCHDIWNFGDSIIKSNSYKSDPLLNYGEQLDGYPLSIDLAGVITLYGDFPKLKLLGVLSRLQAPARASPSRPVHCCQESRKQRSTPTTSMT